MNEGANSAFAPTTPMSGGRSSEQQSSDEDEEERADGDEGELLSSGVTDYGESCDQDEKDEDAAEDEEAMVVTASRGTSWVPPGPG